VGQSEPKIVARTRRSDAFGIRRPPRPATTSPTRAWRRRQRQPDDPATTPPLSRTAQSIRSTACPWPRCRARPPRNPVCDDWTFATGSHGRRRRASARGRRQPERRWRAVRGLRARLPSRPAAHQPSRLHPRARRQLARGAPRRRRFGSRTAAPAWPTSAAGRDGPRSRSPASSPARESTASTSISPRSFRLRRGRLRPAHESVRAAVNSSTVDDGETGEGDQITGSVEQINGGS